MARDHHCTTDVLSLKLTLPKGGQEYLIEHIEVQGTSMRHRVLSQEPAHRLDDVLARPFVAYLRMLLAKLTAQTMVVCDVDAVFVMDGLDLRSVQMLSSLRDTGAIGVVVRFIEVRGDVQALFRDLVTPMQAETNAIAVEAIERVVARTYDVAFVYERMRDLALPRESFTGCTNDILTTREALLFRLDLLQPAVARAHIPDTVATHDRRRTAPLTA